MPAEGIETMKNAQNHCVRDNDHDKDNDYDNGRDLMGGRGGEL
jgi:hypothetical protein